MLVDKDIINCTHLIMKLFLLILLFFSIASTSFACTWTRGNSCYNLVETSHTFWEGETYCNVVFNGHLLAINTMEEDDFIRARLMDLHKPSNGEEYRKYKHYIKQSL